ncbi:hypothetical protein BaRGS_00022654 [Batillaria attramentaria]|uniref:Cytochrome P450 n=1 Tax=Batillaria attramentaria TaxID=370345 RepID=A0ABD0KFW4_9CAEN
MDLASTYTDQLSLLKSTFLVALAVGVVYKIIRSVQDFRAYTKAFRSCPGETDFHWLHGTMHLYPTPDEEGLEGCMKWMEKWPHFNVFWNGPIMPFLVIYHPDLVRIILTSSAPKPRRFGGGLIASPYEMGISWLGEGLLISNGAKWARSRRLLTPAFHFDILRPYVDIQNQAGDVLLEKIQRCAEKGKWFEAFNFGSLCLFDSLLQCAFSHNSNCQTTGANDPYLQTVNSLVEMWAERFMCPWMHVDFIYKLTSHGRKWKRNCDFVHTVSEDLIARRRKFLELNRDEVEKGLLHKKHTMSFVDVLLTAKDEDGKGMTPLEIRNEADTFLFEGFDTTTSALSWTLYSLARWPEHQVRVQEEVDSLLAGRNSDHILWEDFPHLPYTTACIKEAIRLNTTVPWIARMLTEPVTLDGHVIPAGTQVAIDFWCLHHNPTLWDRPHDYIPDRFLGDNLLKIDSFQFLPFSAGSRNCIGQNFAMHELKILVARICHRFTLMLDPNHEVRRSVLATFRAEKGIKLLAEIRKH